MRRLAILSGIMAAVTAALWSTYWIVAASFIEGEIELAFSRGAPGLQTGLESVSVSGFPSAFDVALTKMSAASRHGVTWSTPGATLTAASLNPTRLEIDLSQPQAIGGRWGDLTLKTTEAQVIALFGKTIQLPLQDLRLALVGLDVTHESEAGFAAEKVIAVITNREGEDAGIYRLEMEVTGADLSRLAAWLPEGYGRLGPVSAVVDAFFTSGWEVGALRGEAPAFRGAIIQKATAGFGTSDLTLEGQLLLDPEGTLSGEVTLTVTNWRDLVALAQDLGKIDAETGQVFTDMLSDVEALRGKPGTLEMPLTIRKGSVTYGILTLGLIPPIR